MCSQYTRLYERGWHKHSSEKARVGIRLAVPWTRDENFRSALGVRPLRAIVDNCRHWLRALLF